VFAGKAGAYPSETLFRCSTLGQAPGRAPQTIDWFWSGLPRANTFAYYKNLQLTAMKSLITLVPGHNQYSISLQVIES